MRAGEFPNGARVLRAKIDMASGNINLRDPVLYRILQGAASAHRHHVVDLSELRLRARPVRRDRGHHAFDLHAGVRGSPAALRLVPRQPAGAVAAAPVRVRAAQPHLHGAVEARADRAGARRPCQRLGRSAHADARRPAPPRRAAGGDPRFRQAHRRRQGQQRGRRRHARLLDPRGAEQDGAAAHGGAAAAEGGDRELSGGAERGARRGQQSRRSRRRHAQDPVRPRALHRARRLHGEPAEEILPALARARRCGCATPISSPAARR